MGIADTVKHMDLGQAGTSPRSSMNLRNQSAKKPLPHWRNHRGRTPGFSDIGNHRAGCRAGHRRHPDKMEYLVARATATRSDYFQLFRNSILVQKESHVWFRNRVVTLSDDHDQQKKDRTKPGLCRPGWAIRAGQCAGTERPHDGHPRIYYGSEQYFDGHGPSDQFIWECMFGGEFGAFQSHHRHFFNEESQAYQQLATILELRRKKFALRRGRQYLREISGNGIDFGLPRMLGRADSFGDSLSRDFQHQEILLAINTDYASPRSAWVTIDDGLHHWLNPDLSLFHKSVQIGQETTVEARNGKAVVLTLPAGGLVIYE
ncbi:MAG: hypothetical protein R3B83_05920 [Nitrospirales bacterium]|nr:hypothetical protein [Nitrospirales bacterium]